MTTNGNRKRSSLSWALQIPEQITSWKTEAFIATPAWVVGILSLTLALGCLERMRYGRLVPGVDGRVLSVVLTEGLALSQCLGMLSVVLSSESSHESFPGLDFWEPSWDIRGFGLGIDQIQAISEVGFGTMLLSTKRSFKDLNVLRCFTSKHQTAGKVLICIPILDVS